MRENASAAAAAGKKKKKNRGLFSRILEHTREAALTCSRRKQKN